MLLEESVYSAVVNRIVASQNTVCILCSCYAATGYLRRDTIQISGDIYRRMLLYGLLDI